MLYGYVNVCFVFVFIGFDCQENGNGIKAKLYTHEGKKSI